MDSNNKRYGNNVRLLLLCVFLLFSLKTAQADHPRYPSVLTAHVSSDTTVLLTFNQPLSVVDPTHFSLPGHTINAATQDIAHLDQVHLTLSPPLTEGLYRLEMGDLVGADGLAMPPGYAWFFSHGHTSGVFFEELLDSDPGWPREGQWQYGVPAWTNSDAFGLYGATNAYSGTNVFAVNLTGDYVNNMGNTEYLTTPAIDCSGMTNVTLSFMRWLGIERNWYDHANIQISLNGSQWTTIWANPNYNIDDSAWSSHVIDISQWADLEPTVYIRWGIGPTDYTWRYSGWALDDIRLSGESSVAARPAIVTDLDIMHIDEGKTAPLRLRLSHAPIHDTTVTVFRAAGDPDISVAGNDTFTFTDSNWNDWQTVHLAAAEDDDEIHGVAVIRCASPAASTRDVTVYEIDNDILLLVPNTTLVHVPEGGQASFGLKLNRDPAEPVTVTVAWWSGDPDISVLYGDTLVFTSDNWNNYQWVTLAAAEDDDSVDGVAIIRCSADGVDPVEITAIEQDKDHGLPVTTVRLTDVVLQEDVRRFGINLDDNYWEEPALRIRAAYNFEGVVYRQAHEGEVHTNGFLSYWVNPARMEEFGWDAVVTNGATFRILSGEAKGATGRFVRIESRWVDVYKNGNWTEQAFLVFDEPLTLQTNGVRNMGLLLEDYSRLPQGYLGETNWWRTAGVSLATNSTPPGSYGTVSARLDGAEDAILRLPTHFQRAADANGTWRLQFWSRRESGSPSLLIRSENTYVPQTPIALTDEWQFHDLTLTAAGVPTLEHGAGDVGLILRMQAGNTGTVLIDDVLLWKDGHTNPTAFTDDAVDALRQLNPGIVRYLRMGGDTVTNLLSAPLRRHGFLFGEYEPVGPHAGTSSKMRKTAISLHEIAELAKEIDAVPWFCLPGTLHESEVTLFMEYLSAGPDTDGGAIRIALGQEQPWTEVFDRVHVEFGNEAWNMAAPYKLGGFNGAEYWHDLIATGKAVPTYHSNILFHAAGQSPLTYMSNRILTQTPNADRYSTAPYMIHHVNTSTLAGLDTELDVFNWFMAYPLFRILENGLPQQFMVSQEHDTEFSIYEYNYHGVSGDADTQDVRAAFHVSAAHGASIVNTMLLMLERYGIRDQCFFTLMQYSYQGSRLFGGLHTMRPDLFRARPVFLNLQAIHEVMSGSMRQTELSGDNPPVFAPGRYGSGELLLRAYPSVHAYAFADGPTNGLILINHNLTDAQRVRLALHTYPDEGLAEAWRIIPPTYDAHNEPEVVEPQVILTHEVDVPFHNQLELELAPASVHVYRWTGTQVIPHIIPSTNVLHIHEGFSETLTVRLSHPPDEPIMVLASLAGVQDADFEVTPPIMRTFDADNWAIPQSFTVVAREDPHGVDGSGILRLSADQLSPVDVALHEYDNDPSGADGSTQTLLFDFGSAAAGFPTTNAGWNNITTIHAATVLLDAVDIHDTPTGIDVIIAEPFEFALTDAPNDDTLYPASAQRDFFRTYSGVNGVIRLANVPRVWVSRITIFGSGTQNYGAETGYTVNGVRQTVNTHNNTSQPLVFTNVVSDGNRHITIVVDNAGLSYGRINVLELEGGFPAEPEDSDGDGIPDWWEDIHFGGPTNAVAEALAANLRNTVLETYIANLDPHDPEADFQIDWIARPIGEGVRIEWSGASGRVYSVHRATDPADDYQVIATNRPWTDPVFIDTEPSNESIGLYRISVELAP